MLNPIKNLAILCTVVFGLVFYMANPLGVLAANDYDCNSSGSCFGMDNTVDGDVLPAVGVTSVGRGGTSNIPQLIGKYLGILLSFLGVLFFIMMIYAGFLWMTAQGDDAQVKKAKELLKNAVIGLIIILSAYAITSFVGSSITS